MKQGLFKSPNPRPKAARKSSFCAIDRPLKQGFSAISQTLLFSCCCFYGLANLRNWLCLALNWVCFFAASKPEILHNHLSYRHLRSFCPFENWLCFFKFVFAVRRTQNEIIGFVWLCFSMPKTSKTPQTFAIT